MNPQTANTIQLRDIHLPDAISWWPPAIGWWILLALILLSLYLLPKLYRRLTYVSLNTLCLKDLEIIQSAYKAEKNALESIQALSKLLRQISMTYNDRDKVAHLTGEQWTNTLNALTEKDYFTDEHKKQLMNAPYQKESNIDIEGLFTVTQQWIKALPSIKSYKKSQPKNEIANTSPGVSL